jgi:hypothetical protein
MKRPRPEMTVLAAAMATAVLDEWDRVEGRAIVTGDSRTRLAAAIERGFMAIGRAFAKRERRKAR